MERTRSNYLAITWGVPFGAFGVLFIFISFINRRTNWFILRTVLGINSDIGNKKAGIVRYNDSATKWIFETKQDDGTGKGSSNSSWNGGEIIEYLYVKLDDNDEVNRFPCILRFLSDLLASAILGIFAAIIFNNLLLTYATIRLGTTCPKFDADCFGTNDSIDVGPFSCSNGQNATFPVSSTSVWCVGWIYQNIDENDVLNTLGTCGGLLGIISAIIPFVYYLSYWRRRCYISLLCVLLPIAAIISLVLLLTQRTTDGLSQLALIIYWIVIAMVFIGWAWAFWRSCEPNVSKCKCVHICIPKPTSPKIIKYCCWWWLVLPRRYHLYPWECVKECCCTNLCHVCRGENIAYQNDDYQALLGCCGLEPLPDVSDSRRSPILPFSVEHP